MPQQQHTKQQQKREATAAEARTKIRELVDEYETLRRTMPAGDSRTQKMAKIASQMRALAGPAIPFLKDFVESAAAGERLAAVSIGNAKPGIFGLACGPDQGRETVHWLSRRMRIACGAPHSTLIASERSSKCYRNSAGESQLLRLERSKSSFRLETS
jgi:hypothetical protein